MYVCGAVKVVSFVSACPYEINRSPIGCADVHIFLELCNSINNEEGMRDRRMQRELKNVQKEEQRDILCKDLLLLTLNN